MAKGAQLSVEVQTFVVQALACFDFPSVVVAAVKAEFGLALTRQRVEAYDPNKQAGKALSERWRVLFEKTRKDFVDDTSSIAISHRAARLRTLQRMAAKAEDMGNMTLAATLLEQAAKEMGNAYTNTRVLSGGLEVTAPKSLADFYGRTNT
jgi:hypothetical protein